MLMGCIPRCFNNSLMCEFVKHGPCGYSGRKYEISLIESLQVTYDCMTRRQELLVYWGLFPESVQHSAQSVKFPKQSDCYIVCVGLLCIVCFVEPFFGMVLRHRNHAGLKFGCPPSANFETPQPCGMFTSSSKVFEQETAEYERHSISVYLGHSSEFTRRWGQEEQCERWQVWMLSVWGLGPVTNDGWWGNEFGIPLDDRPLTARLSLQTEASVHVSLTGRNNFNSSGLVERGFPNETQSQSVTFFVLLLPWMSSVCKLFFCGYSRYSFSAFPSNLQRGWVCRSNPHTERPVWSPEVSRIDCPEGPLKNKHSMMDLMNAKVISTPRLTGPFGLRPLVLRRRQGKPLKNWFMIKAVRNKQLVQPIPV